MNLREILDRVAASKLDDWHQVAGFPVPAPEQLVITGKSKDDMRLTRVRQNYLCSVLTQHPAVSLAWGMEVDGDMRLGWTFPAEVSDSKIPYCSADIMLSGAVVHREYYMDGDGVFLPTPGLIGLQVIDWDDRFVRLLNELSGITGYNEARQRYGLEVVAGHPLDPPPRARRPAARSWPEEPPQVPF